jgi:hypothetical protein
MATHLTRRTNGVSYGYKHTVTSTDVTDGSVIIDFQVDTGLLASFMVTNSNGLIIDTKNGKLTYPAEGQVKIEPQATSGTAEVTSITTVADDSDSLDGTYFLIYDDAGSVGVWIDTDDSGTTAPAGASGADRALEVATIATDDDADTVASKIATVLNNDSKFTASATGSVITCTASTVGTKTDASDGDTGFSIAVVVEGVPAVIEGTFTLEAGQIIHLIANRNSGQYTYN